MRIAQPYNPLTIPASELAGEYKSRLYRRDYAFDRFVADRALKPELSAKEFYKLFDAAQPVPIEHYIDVDFQPTHYDTMLSQKCMVSLDEFGVRRVIWEDAHYGSHPPGDADFYSRYIPFLGPVLVK